MELKHVTIIAETEGKIFLCFMISFIVGYRILAYYCQLVEISFLDKF